MTNGRPSKWRLAAVATLLSAFVSLGFSIAGLVVPGLIKPGAILADVWPFAGYAAARSAVIASATLIALSRRSIGPLITVGWIAGGVQALDALVGLAQHDVGKTVGPAILAAFSMVALTRLMKQSAGERVSN